MLTYLRRHHAGLIALFVALGGTSYAAATVGSQDIQSRAVETRHLDRGAVTTGEVTRQTGGFRIVKGPNLPGDYRVVFPAGVAVESCAWIAGQGDGVTTASPPFDGEIVANRSGGDAPRVDVYTRNSAGNLEDRPFHLLVLC